MTTLTRTSRALTRIEDLEFMCATGERLQGVCRRLETSPASLYQFLLRYGRIDLWLQLNREEPTWP